jgi:cation diffusion facilitator CzcD-associated flavoprotein CzcO
MNLSSKPQEITIDEDAAQTRLCALAARARAELDMLNYATRPWVSPRCHLGQAIPDVVILGASQSGLVVGHSLKRRGVTNILLLDRKPAGHEGIWSSYARNYELRSPKTITGLDLGIPSLTVQSWYIARYGQQAWEQISRIPRCDWLAYLRWYAGIADLPVRNEIEVIDIAYDVEKVTLTTSDGEAIHCRYLVLASGMEGGGDWVVPRALREALPRCLYTHACEVYEAEDLAGKDIGILGAGAGAFDAAVAALGAGAHSVATFMRRPQISLIDLVRELENAGVLNHYPELPDRIKWEVATMLSGLSQAPAEQAFNKALSYPNFRFWTGAPWQEIRHEGGKVVVLTPRGRFQFDHVISATGVTTDMGLRPELRNLAKDAALWRDRFLPDNTESDDPRLNFPYLDHDYRFQPRKTGSSAGIGRVFAFNALAALSMGGLGAVSISGHRYGATRLTTALTRALFLDQADELIPYLRGFDTPCIELSTYARQMLGMASA